MIIVQEARSASTILAKHVQTTLWLIRSHSDSEHEALDGDVLKNFELQIKLGREPNWASLLLSDIVKDDDRLKRMSMKEVEELLRRHSFLVPISQKGWTSRSFAEVRRLHMLHFSIPSDHHC